MSGDNADRDGQSEHAWDGAISRAVEMGYKVIEDQITQGRQFAEQLTRGAAGAGPDDAFGPDLNQNAGADLMARVLHFYSDMGALCFEMFETVTRNPAFADMLRSTRSPEDVPGAPRSAGGQGHALAVEIVSSERSGARVTQEWLRDPGERALAVAELRSLDPGVAAIGAVEFERAADGWPAVLRISIPSGQAPGNYSGLIVVADTNEPCGTLLLNIPAASTNGAG